MFRFWKGKGTKAHSPWLRAPFDYYEFLNFYCCISRAPRQFYQGAWRQSPLLPSWSIRSRLARWYFISPLKNLRKERQKPSNPKQTIAISVSRLEGGLDQRYQDPHNRASENKIPGLTQYMWVLQTVIRNSNISFEMKNWVCNDLWVSREVIKDIRLKHSCYYSEELNNVIPMQSSVYPAGSHCVDNVHVCAGCD